MLLLCSGIGGYICLIFPGKGSMRATHLHWAIVSLSLSLPGSLPVPLPSLVQMATLVKEMTARRGEIEDKYGVRPRLVLCGDLNR